MKNLLFLLFVFLSFNVHSQHFKTDPARKSLLSNEYVRKAEGNILTLLYNWKTDTDTTIAFKEIRENALKAAKNDTLLIFISGGLKRDSNSGKGIFDSLTLNYSFLYESVYADCIITKEYETGKEIYNSIIEDEIAKRHGKNWEAEIEKKMDDFVNIIKIKEGSRADFLLLVQNEIIDSIDIKNIENIDFRIDNMDKVYSFIEHIKRKEEDSIKVEIIFIKDRKLVKEYKDLKIGQIKDILAKELPNYSSDSLDKVYIGLDIRYYSLGRYIYPIK